MYSTQLVHVRIKAMFMLYRTHSSTPYEIKYSKSYATIPGGPFPP